MKDPLALSNNKAGPNHLNSWRWSCVDHHIGRHHRGEVHYPLTTQARGQSGLCDNKRDSPILDGERGIRQEQLWRRPEQLPLYHPSARLICLCLQYRLHPPAWPRKNGNRPSMDSVRGVEAHTLQTQGSETDVQQVHNCQHRPEEQARLVLWWTLILQAETFVHGLYHEYNNGAETTPICQLCPHLRQ